MIEQSLGFGWVLNCCNDVSVVTVFDFGKVPTLSFMVFGMITSSSPEVLHMIGDAVEFCSGVTARDEDQNY